MKKVFVNGYGTIGSRIAKFIKDDSDIVVIGIGKHSPDEKVFKNDISAMLNLYQYLMKHLGMKMIRENN